MDQDADFIHRHQASPSAQERARVRSGHQPMVWHLEQQGSHQPQARLCHDGVFALVWPPMGQSWPGRDLPAVCLDPPT